MNENLGQYPWQADPKGHVEIPSVVVDHMMEIANKHHTTIADVYRQIMKFGFVVIDDIDTGRANYIRESTNVDEEDAYVLFFRDQSIHGREVDVPNSDDSDL